MPGNSSAEDAAVKPDCNVAGTLGLVLWEFSVPALFRLIFTVRRFAILDSMVLENYDLEHYSFREL